MGASQSLHKMDFKLPQLYVAPKKKSLEIEVNAVSPPEYKFSFFIKQCEQLQQDKYSTHANLRFLIREWKKNVKERQPAPETRQEIYALLSRFRTLQEEQNILIQRERARMEAIEAEQGEHAANKLRKRIQYFNILNEQNQSLISKVQKDSLTCRAIVQDASSGIRESIKPVRQRIGAC